MSLTMILLKVGQHFLHIKPNCHVEVRVIKLIKFDMINNLECCGGRCWECSLMAVEWKLIKLVTAQFTILIDVSAIQTDSHRLNEKIAISNFYPKLSSYMSYTKVDSTLIATPDYHLTPTLHTNWFESSQHTQHNQIPWIKIS